MVELQHLVAQAVALGGGDLCAGGHEWSTEGEGVRACPRGGHECSQAVYVCVRCGDYDYGEKDGPGWRDCFQFGPCAPLSDSFTGDSEQ